MSERDLPEGLVCTRTTRISGASEEDVVFWNRSRRGGSRGIEDILEASDKGKEEEMWWLGGDEVGCKWSDASGVVVYAADGPGRCCETGTVEEYDAE